MSCPWDQVSWSYLKSLKHTEALWNLNLCNNNYISGSNNSIILEGLVKSMLCRQITKAQLFLQIILLHIFPELLTISFLHSVLEKIWLKSLGVNPLRKKVPENTVYIYRLESNCRSVFSIIWTKERIQTDEKISLWVRHAVQNTEYLYGSFNASST